MAKTLEWCLEEVAMQIARRQSELTGIQCTHYDNKEARKANRIVFTAKVGARRNDGPKGYDCELSIEYVTPKQVAVVQADSVMAGIERAFSDDSLEDTDGIPAYSYFSVLVINETGGDGNKENEDKRRVRTLTIPAIADLI